MANQITLGATLLFNGGDGTGGAPDDLAGVATGTADTSTFLEGSTSYTYSASNTRSGMLYDAGTAQDWSSNVFYITVNSGVVGLLTDFRIRFCGATVTDFFEVEVGSASSWPSAISGGWVTFVVDIETAKADAGRITGGTEPATNAIRYVGFSQLLSTMPKMADNTWFDTVYRLPDGTSGIIVEGRNGGTTDWTAADILTQLGSGQMFYYRSAADTYTLTTSIQFGINDTTTHGFADTNAVWLFDNQAFVPDDVYKLSALGNASGTTNVRFGEKTGTGITATGAQGFTVRSASTGPRWSMDFDDPNLDSIDFYGCSFSHGGDFQLDDIAVESINTLYIDVTTVNASNSDLFTRNTYINPNTAANNSSLIWNEAADVDGILNNSSFTKGTAAHHAIEFGTNIPDGASYTLRNCDFGTDFSATEGGTAGNETFHFLDTTGSITLNLVACTGNFGYRTEGVSVTIVADPVTTSVTVNDNTGAPLLGARVRLEASSGAGDLPFEDSVSITRSGSTASVSHTAHGLVNGNKVIIRGANQSEYNGVKTISNVTTNAYDFTVSGQPTSPATGTIISSGVLLEGLTDSSGEISDVRTYTLSQPYKGIIRKATTPPIFKDFPLSGTVSNTTGASVSAQLILDQ